MTPNRRLAAKLEPPGWTTAVVCEEAGVELPVPVEDFAAISFAIGEGLSSQRDFDPDAVPADLFAKAELWLWEGVQTFSTPTTSGAADHPAPLDP